MTRLLVFLLAYSALNSALSSAEQVIVYRSRAEQAWDQLLWENPEYILVFIGILLAAPVALAAFRWFKRLRRY